MGPERQRRLVAVLLLSLVFLVTSWLEEAADHSSSASKRVGRSLGAAGESRKRKGDYEGHTTQEEGGYDSLDDEEDDDDDIFYTKTFKTKSRLFVRTTAFNFDFQSCLPRFICEVHSVSAGGDLTDLEKDILGLFRNYVVLEGPGSPVYHYQLAAHMGHLLTGLEPSPCYSLYPSCPLSRLQLIEILRNVKSSRRMLY